MIKHELSDLFRQNSIHKKFVINYDGGTITNSDLFMEEFSLEESICSEEELRFGSCEASVIKFPISNVFTSLNGRVLDVSVVLDNNEDKPLKIGKYKVASDVPTADRKRKDITAYDSLYDVINTDVAEWYNALLPNNDSTVTLKQFRDSFFGYFGIEQVKVALINDSMIVTKTIQPTELSGSMVANAICELNGCFGHINRDGLMDYVFLKGFTEALYPSDDLYPAEDLFPEESNYHKYTKSDYPSGGCQYEDYSVRKITGIEIRQAEDSVGAFVGEKENPYVVSDNFLTYGKSTEEMTTIAQNMFNVINGIEYRPFTLNTFRGNPCVEVGDGIRIYTDNQIIQSYVLNRTLTGIQALSDAFETNGKEYRTAQVNSVQSQITQLKGKTNRLERTAEETLSQISDLEKQTSTEIRQLSDSVAITIDEKGNVSTDLTLDVNGMTFIGKKFVVESENFKLDEYGDVELKGMVYSDNGLSIFVPAYTTVAGAKYEAGYHDVVTQDTKNINIGVVDSPNDTDTYFSFDRNGIVTLYANGEQMFHVNEYGTYGYVFFDAPIGADGGIIGTIACSDNTQRVPIGSSADATSDAKIAYITAKGKNSDENYYITVSGLWGGSSYASHNIVSASSDIRLKENINPTKVENALDVVNKFGVYEFDWKDSGAHQKIGFIADYLQEVDERLAVGGGYEEDGTPNYKTVDNFYMQGYIVKAIQELSEENRELKSEIDELKKSVSFLMKKLGGMADE